MKKAVLKIVICLLAMLALSVVLVACNPSGGKANYKYQVVFDYNEGNSADDEDVKTQCVGVRENALVSIRPGYSNKLPEIPAKGFYIGGWWTAKLDEEGNPVRDEDGVVELEREWDFGNDRVTENITLYAKLLKQASLIFVDRATGEPVDGDNGIYTYKPGTVIAKSLVDALPPEKENSTFLGKYYADRTGDTEFRWPYVFTTEDKYVYVEFIDGTGWTFVSTADEFVNAMAISANIYLQADIDLSDKTNLWNEGLRYSGNFNGNGHTVSGIHRSIQMTSNSATVSGAIFGTLTSKAYIHDVTFIDIEYTMTILRLSATAKGVSIGLFAGSATNGAKVENVTISGSLTYQAESGSITVNGNGWIADNKAKQEDISGCDYGDVEVTQTTTATE